MSTAASIAQSVERQATGWADCSFSGKGRKYILLCSYHNVLAAHPAIYKMGTVGNFVTSKRVRK
jgi:hypothetical protein